MNRKRRPCSFHCIRAQWRAMATTANEPRQTDWRTNWPISERDAPQRNRSAVPTARLLNEPWSMVNAVKVRSLFNYAHAKVITNWWCARLARYWIKCFGLIASFSLHFYWKGIFGVAFSGFFCFFCLFFLFSAFFDWKWCFQMGWVRKHQMRLDGALIIELENYQSQRWDRTFIELNPKVFKFSNKILFGSELSKHLIFCPR